MRPSVIVPVLSVATTVTDPSVSTAGSARTMTWRRAMRCAPTASAIVTTSGSDSGSAATVRLSPTSSISPHGRPWTSPMRTTTAVSVTTSTARPRLRPVSRRWSGVGRDRPSCSIAAIRPRLLLAPVRVTSTTARPWVVRPPATSSSPGPCGTGSDSPVTGASSTSRSCDCRTTASAGTRSPAVRLTWSPGTTSPAGTVTSSSSRRTTAVGAAICSSSSMTRSARCCWRTPTVVLKTTTARMITVLGQSRSTAPRTAASCSSTIIGSRSWSATRSAVLRRGLAGAMLGPTARRRRAASSELRAAEASAPIVDR